MIHWDAPNPFENIDKGLYGVNFNYGNFQGPRVDLLFPYGKESKTNITKILVDAPYNFKRKGIKK